LSRIAYPFQKGLYLNITNRCPTACRFCLKRILKWRFERWDFRLQKEPSVHKILMDIRAASRNKTFPEIVFCGYGECTYRLPEMLEVCHALRKLYPKTRLRLNTVGLGNLIWGKDIVADLKGSLDAMAVSLNTTDPKEWILLHAPAKKFQKRGFVSVQEFIRSCVKAGLLTTVTAVELPGTDMAAVRRLAADLGASFRARPAI
jgi:TatD family-associated radical SAM protein